MKRRILYGLALALLIASATLVIWQGSFNFGKYGPTSPEQTFIYWAVSTLVFLLTVTLGFILFRTGLKLYVERRSGMEGSRIRTKLVVGALALSFTPVFFLVLWSVEVMNRNLDKWFSVPAQNVLVNLDSISKALQNEAADLATIHAAYLSAHPDIQQMVLTGERAGGFERLCADRNIVSASAIPERGGPWLPICVPRSAADNPTPGMRVIHAPVMLAGEKIGEVAVAAVPRIEITEKKREIDKYVAQYAQFEKNRKSFRNFYLLLLALITLFVLFFATWLALFLAKQISNPIAALLEAAGQVRRGNLGYRIQARALDELAALVRAFNEMTRDLEANSRELERRRRFTEAILESIPTGVLSISSDGTIQRANRALSNLLPPERIARATRLEDLFSREDTADIKYMMKRARRTGSAERQLDLKTDRGTLNLVATVCALEEKLTSGFVLVLEDTTDLLRAQKTAAWHEVARRIAHEIKNPLTPIALCSERIARQLDRLPVPPESARILKECCATIGNEVESVKSLVDEFSQFSRFPTAQPVICDLNEVVDNALGVFAGRLDGIEIQRDLTPALPPVNIDREQFKRAIVNLVDNAAESMQDSLVKRLYVGTHLAAHNEAVELVVEDTGRGISPEDKDRLFLPYFSTKGRGTGLGLAIVNHILTEHHASIRVEDNTPAGARFIVDVPIPVSNEDSRPLEARA